MSKCFIAINDPSQTRTFPNGHIIPARSTPTKNNQGPIIN